MFYVKRSDGKVWGLGPMGYGFVDGEPVTFRTRKEAELVVNRAKVREINQGFTFEILENHEKEETNP